MDVLADLRVFGYPPDEEDTEYWVDYYAILGLPSGEYRFKLSKEEITKAYKKKAFQLHPDKRPNDRDKAIADIQRLNLAHFILTHESARENYDDDTRFILKRTSALERRERGDFTVNPGVEARQEQERISRLCIEDHARVMRRSQEEERTGKVGSPTEDSRSGTTAKDSTSGLDKERVLKAIKKQKLSSKADP